LNPQKKKKLGNIIRVLISFVFLGALIFILKDKLPEVLREIKNANRAYFISALLLFLFPMMMLLAYRVKPIFKVQKIKLSFFYLYFLRYIGFFFNNFLPSAVGGDLASAYLVSRKTGRGIESFTAIFIDRLVGFFTIFLFAFAAFFFMQKEINLPYIGPLIIGIIIFMVVLPFFLFSRRVARPFQILVKWLPKPVFEKLKTIYHAIYQYRRHPFTLINVTICSLLFQALGIFVNYLLGQSVGIELPLFKYFLLIPLVWLISMIPSLGGLGVREGGYVVLFASFGAGSDKAFALSILFYSLTVCASIIGSICYLFAGRVSREDLEKMQAEDMQILEKEKRDVE